MVSEKLSESKELSRKLTTMTATLKHEIWSNEFILCCIQILLPSQNKNNPSPDFIK